LLINKGLYLDVKLPFLSLKAFLLGDLLTSV
jgi:hypothetical protein